MKREKIISGMAVFFMICMTVCFMSGICSMASGVESDPDVVQKPGEISVSGNEEKEKAGEKSMRETVSDNDYGINPTVTLEVPENLDFVIDPWNLSGKGQIYSRRFVISNTGNTACTLYLQDIVCRPEEEGAIYLLKDTAEVYESDAANVCLELIFETGEIITLTSRKSEYSVELEPGSKLSFWFTGKVNEKNSGNWSNNQLLVSLKYFWSCDS